jgi:ElaB/YqjD/DUF883 family membrane-anchored ribosome-binding protein
MRRVVGRPRSQHIQIFAADEINVVDRAVVTKETDSGASLEAKVEFLLQRDREAQDHVNQLRAQVETVETETQKRLDDLQREMEQHVGDVVAAAHREYLPLRLVGVAALVVGFGCVTAANFV